MKKSTMLHVPQQNRLDRLSSAEELRSERVKAYIRKTNERFVSSLKLDHAAVTLSGSGVLAGSIRKK